jgi:hypothetical protein
VSPKNYSQNPKAIVKVKIYFHVFAAIIAQAVSAQSTTTLMGGRAAGLGYATAVTEDEWSLFNNIGGLAKVNQLNASFAYEARPALIGANRMAASISAPSKIGTVGVGIFRFGDDVYGEHQMSFGVGNQIGNTSLGAKVNYTQYRVESFGNTSVVSFDFGGITKITSLLSIGAYITNLTQSKLLGTDGERIPTKLVLGVGFKPSNKIFVATELEKDLDYQTIWKTGLEYSIYEKVFFRTGFNLNPNAAYFGLGAQKKNLKFDYAIRFNQLTGAAHQLSATYLIPSKIKK